MRIQESLFRDLLRLVIWYPGRWLIERMPAERALALLGRMGDLHGRLSPAGRRELHSRLSIILPEADEAFRDWAIWQYYRNHYIDRLIIFIFPRLTADRLDGLLTLEGREHLDTALEEGRGVVLVHGHFGPVHLPLVVLSLLGYRMKQIGLPTDEGLSWVGRRVAFRLRLSYESKIPAEIIHAGSFMRKAFNWLQENGIIMVTGDGSGTERLIGRHRVFQFLGQPVLFPLGPARLACCTGACLLPLFILPGEDGRYRILIEAPIRSDEPGEGAELDMTTRFIHRYEERVRQCPGYMHFLDKFHPGGMIATGSEPIRPTSPPGCMR